MTSPTAPPGACLTLIGVVHLDPGGYDRLLAALAALAPALVTVEVSPYALAFRATRGPSLRAALDGYRAPGGTLPPGLQAVAAQLEPPFEVRAVQDAGVPVVLVGDSARSRALLARFEEELMQPENLARLAREAGPSLAEQTAREWRRAQRLHHQPPLLGTEDAARLARLEDQLATQIREAVADLAPPGRGVHVGGWEHLHGLQARLAKLVTDVQLLHPPR